MTAWHIYTATQPNGECTETHLWGFLTPPVAGADLRAAFVASCLRGALPPVDLRAVCLVRAMALRYVQETLRTQGCAMKSFVRNKGTSPVEG